MFEPNTISDRLIDLVKERENIMPHFHVPIQSGSTSILKKMRRHYDRPGIERILDRICNAIPNLALGSDFIVGFPQETDTDFQDTVSLIESYPFTYFHTFTFSSRQNTIAARMDGHIDKKIKFERSEYLRKLSDFKKADYYSKHLGQSHRVLLEKVNSDDSVNGFTENYIKVKIENAGQITNSIQSVQLNEYKNQFVLANII